MSLATKPLPLAVWLPAERPVVAAWRARVAHDRGPGIRYRGEVTRMDAQVVDVRARHRRRRNHLAIDRRFPFGRYRIDETRIVPGGRLACSTLRRRSVSARLSFSCRYMANTTSNVPCGCQCTGRDRSRRYSKGRTRRAVETGVDTGRHRRESARGRRPAEPHTCVRQGPRTGAGGCAGRSAGCIADELRESSGGHPPRQVHLEVAILRVYDSRSHMRRRCESSPRSQARQARRARP